MSSSSNVLISRRRLDVATNRQSPTNTTSTNATRVPCTTIGPFNRNGNKTVLGFTKDGLSYWCKYCRKPETISREQVLRIWEELETTTLQEALPCTAVTIRNRSTGERKL